MSKYFPQRCSLYQISNILKVFNAMNIKDKKYLNDRYTQDSDEEQNTY